jgi:hypothetical protein
VQEPVRMGRIDPLERVRCDWQPVPDGAFSGRSFRRAVRG